MIIAARYVRTPFVESTKSQLLYRAMGFLRDAIIDSANACNLLYPRRIERPIRRNFDFNPTGNRKALEHVTFPRIVPLWITSNFTDDILYYAIVSLYTTNNGIYIT